LLDVDPGPVAVAQRLELVLGLDLDRLAPDGQNLAHAVVAHDLAHAALRHVPQGIAHGSHVENVLVGVGDAVLNDPFHVGDVQVTREHARLAIGHLGRIFVLGLDGGPMGAEAELLLQLALDRHAEDLLDEGKLEVRSRLGGTGIGSETRDQAHFLGLDLIVADPRQEQHQQQADDRRESRTEGGCDAARRATQVTRGEAVVATVTIAEACHVNLTSRASRARLCLGQPRTLRGQVRCGVVLGSLIFIARVALSSPRRAVIRWCSG
jgi:hypothetical protein